MTDTLEEKRSESRSIVDKYYSVPSANTLPKYEPSIDYSDSQLAVSDNLKFHTQKMSCIGTDKPPPKSLEIGIDEFAKIDLWAVTGEAEEQEDGAGSVVDRPMPAGTHPK